MRGKSLSELARWGATETERGSGEGGVGQGAAEKGREAVGTGDKEESRMLPSFLGQSNGWQLRLGSLGWGRAGRVTSRSVLDVLSQRCLLGIRVGIDAELIAPLS